MTGVRRVVADPREIILLLHGLNERGKRIYRKLLPYLPSDALIISPNGIFPLPDQRSDGLRLGFTWYIFDVVHKTYQVNQDQAKLWLRDLVASANPHGLPVTVIGFSQGGYLAPLVGKEIAECKRVLGLACEFRAALIKGPLGFDLHALHGSSDPIISIQSAQNEVQLLKEKHINCTFHTIQETGHEISASMGETVRKILRDSGKRSL